MYRPLPAAAEHCLHTQTLKHLASHSAVSHEGIGFGLSLLFRTLALSPRSANSALSRLPFRAMGASCILSQFLAAVFSPPSACLILHQVPFVSWEFSRGIGCARRHIPGYVRSWAALFCWLYTGDDGLLSKVGTAAPLV